MSILLGALLLCGGGFAVLLRAERRQHGRGLTGPEIRGVLIRARWGWMLIPLLFLYAGTSLAAVVAMLHGSVPAKALGGFAFVAISVALGVYLTRVVRRVLRNARCDRVPDDEQLGCPVVGDLQFCELHGLLCVTLFLSVAAAAPAESHAACIARMAVLAAVPDLVEAAMMGLIATSACDCGEPPPIELGIGECCPATLLGDGIGWLILFKFA
eukprot:gene19354-10703_t